MEAPLVELEAVFEPVYDNEDNSQREEEEPFLLMESSMLSRTSDTMHTAGGTISLLDEIAPISPRRLQKQSSIASASITSRFDDRSETDGGGDGGKFVQFPPRKPASSKASASITSRFDDPLDIDLSVSHHTMKRGGDGKLKLHHLGLKSNWTLTSCNVCKSSILPSPFAKTKLYHCEVCGIYCCDDCRISVEVKLPCGSDLAKQAREEAAQSMLSVDKILNVLAPVDASAAKRPSSNKRRTSMVDYWQEEEKDRIGTMKLEFIGALVFEEALPANSNATELLRKNNDAIKLRTGDYYIRVSWTGSPRTSRTPLTQNTGRPRFEAEEMRFNV
jgi:hypothetical protein